MAESEISKEELQKEIAEILDHASLENTSTKKVIQKLEKKLGMDLTEKKKMIDQLVMDYVNSLDSDESMDEEEKKEVVQKKAKKVDHHDDEEEDDDEEQDDRNDSDYGFQRDSDVFLDGSSEENYRPLQQESTITTSRRIQPLPNPPKKAIILKRVAQQSTEEDECDIFGKLTAKKLRKLPEEKRDSMMIQINQMFYEKRYGRPILSPNRTQDHITIPSSTALHLTPTQLQAKRIYPLNTIPTLIKSCNVSSASNVPAAVVLPTNNVPVAVPAAVPTATVAQPVANAARPVNNDTAPARCANNRYSCYII